MVGIGLATPVWHSFNRDAFAAFGAADTLPELIAQLGFPLVVKPAREGSSLGIKFVNSSEEFSQVVVGALRYDHRLVVQPPVSGPGLAATVLGPPGEARGAPAIGIVIGKK